MFGAVSLESGIFPGFHPMTTWHKSAVKGRLR